MYFQFLTLLGVNTSVRVEFDIRSYKIKRFFLHYNTLPYLYKQCKHVKAILRATVAPANLTKTL